MAKARNVFLRSADTLETAPWMLNGIGRIRRDGYILRIGEEQINIDELRTYYLHTVMRPALEKLKPLTAAETLYLAHIVARAPEFTTLPFMTMLMELVVQE